MGPLLKCFLLSLGIGVLTVSQCRAQEFEFVRAWPDSLVGSKRVSIKSLLVTKNGHLLAGSWWNWLYKSTDDGKTWVQIGAQSGLIDYQIMGLATNDKGWIFAATGYLGLFRSKDDGETWEELTGNRGNGLPQDIYEASIGITPRNEIFVGGLVIETGKFADNAGVWKSTDDGDTWKVGNAGLPRYQRSIPPYDTIIASGRSFAFLGDTVFTCTGGDVPYEIGRPYDFNRVCKSSDGGTTWVFSDSGIPARTPLRAMTSTGESIFTGGVHIFYDSTNTHEANKVYRSRDGANWEPVLTASVWCLVSTPFGPFAGSDGFGERWHGILFQSRNGGDSWKELDFPASAEAVYSIAVKDSLLFVGTWDGVFRGRIKPKINHAPSVFRLLIPANRDTVRITFPTKPIKFTWRASSDVDMGDSLRYTLELRGPGIDTTLAGLRDTTVQVNIMSRLQINSAYTWTATVSDGLISVASPDTFTFRTSAAVTAVEELAGEIPKEYALRQNYPNPFNPSTTIEFALPKSAFVTLRVYDLLGRQVGELVNEKLAPGNYKTQWDARGFASGVYFYRLQAGQFVETKKLVLLR
jgi:hypothetical protein